MTDYRFSGEISFEEYLEAHLRLAAKRRWWIRGVLLLYGVGAIAYSLLVAEGGSRDTFLGLGIAGIIYATLISPWQFRFRVGRNWKRYPRVRKPIDITVNEEGITALDDKGSPSLTAWENLIRFDETKSLFLLYLSPLLPILLPKRLLQGETARVGFRELAAASIRPVP